MRVLIAFDKFKDAITAKDACEIARASLKAIKPDWEIEIAPIADGGDGFCATLGDEANGSHREVSCLDPLGRATTATYSLVSPSSIRTDAKEALSLDENARKLAIIEMAQSSGIALVPMSQRSPWTLSSAGLGSQIRHAIDAGADTIVIGLGGSATHDLALGALWELGFTLRKNDGAVFDSPPIPSEWSEIARIEKPRDFPDLSIRLACDVENPLLGANGAAAIFGPQKGLQPEDYKRIEAETDRMANALCASVDMPEELKETPGSGAAGGAGFGLMVGLGAKIIPGMDLVEKWIGLDGKAEKAELIVTGEGRFDKSSLQGKGPGQLVRMAVETGKHAVVFAGSLDPEIAASEKAVLVGISDPRIPLAESIKATKTNLESSIRTTFEKWIIK